MLDFVKISTRTAKKGRGKITVVVEVYPQFIIKKSKDLMIRGKAFYAIWDDSVKLWSTDPYRAVELIDAEIEAEYKKIKESIDNNEWNDGSGVVYELKPLYLWDANTGSADLWNKYCQKLCTDNYHPLDDKLIFSNIETTRSDYASKKLPYPLLEGDCPAYEEIISTLYNPEERLKLEWAIGSIVCGDSKKIQKFEVIYGSAGTGKSTILNIIQMLFEGYCSIFDAKALGSGNDQFALEAFKDNPLVAIQHDGDLSRIEDNTRLNSLVSHETMKINEKYKATYSATITSFLFMGTNKPVKITEAKSGLMRRLIDVSPSGKKIPQKRYYELMAKVKFELGAIALHCEEVYKENKSAYDNYKPLEMMGASNDFYNFIEDNYDIFDRDNCTTLKAAWMMYKDYVDDAKIQYPYNLRNFKVELKNYFGTFSERTRLEDGTQVRNFYEDFLRDKFIYDFADKPVEVKSKGFKFDSNISLLDEVLKDCPAQYANEEGTPKRKWESVKTTLSDISTNKLHYVKVPENHIVIDFDIKDKNGNKSFKKNLEAANKWPETYGELSKSGEGIHLHYIYEGDVDKLSRIFDEDIEVKVFTGNSSLRRMLSKCNDIPVRTINSGLPMKGESKVVDFEGIKNEKVLRSMIERNLRKEIHGATKPSVDFIFKILEDAYNSDLKYDVTDMRPAIMAFAANSSHQADACLKLVSKMHFKSEEASEGNAKYEDATLVFYDVEVFPNLFVVVWKAEGKSPVKMINPTKEEIESLLRFRLVGFNCRRYDNHIMYARMMGYSNAQLYSLSKRIIEGSPNCMFGEAYNLSYTDIYDFSAKKQSLKKFEIELGIHHQECGLPWDQPVPEDRWDEVADYCVNDVEATEAVFNARKGDFTARQILASLADMTVNDTTNSLTTRIIFGKEKHPKLVYTDLSKEFPGYHYVDASQSPDSKPHNYYMGEDVGFGGYVYAEPGMYGDVALLDVASLHPHSIIAMNCFGEYTSRFKDLLDARMYIKHKEFDKARKMLDGKLAPYLDDEGVAKDLAQALKIAINSVYGLTSASFDNPFRDPRNVNNIVALRGALFMVNLKHEVQDRGFKVAHIKTDSIKIPDANSDIINFCMNYAKKYGYIFEHEATYDRICLVNDAVYIAKDKSDNHWTATGTQFAVPYVFKSLFSKEPIEFQDLCETKAVSTALYLDMNEGMLDTTKLEQELYVITKGNREPERQEELKRIISENHSYHFVGKIGLFCPIKPGCGGGELLREGSNGKFSSATGAKGYRWLESEIVKELKKEKDIDKSYYNRLVDEAVEVISKYGDFEWFVSDDPYVKPIEMADFMNVPEGYSETGIPFDEVKGEKQ